jgi:four helix bundle protein
MQTQHSLTVINLMLSVVRRLAPLVRVIEGHDKDLGRQIRKAASSVVLNLGEANGSDPGNRRARLFTALGSAKETRLGLQTAVAWGYIPEQPELDRDLDRVAAMTFRLTKS